MKTHVIDFTPQGEAQAMHRDSFDLSFLGKQTIERASEITFDQDTQMWDIQVLGDFNGQRRIVGESYGYSTYEGARKVEVEWFNECRLRGIPPESPAGKDVLSDIRMKG